MSSADVSSSNLSIVIPIVIDFDKCDGCLACVRLCPNKALRVRRGKALILPDLCLSCGACVGGCPKSAIKTAAMPTGTEAKFKVTAVLPSPVLYTQFGGRIVPNDVLLGLTRMGYDYVFDQALYCEWVSMAIGEWIEKQVPKPPAISTTCPAVTRLILTRYPDLAPRLVRIAPPRVVGARSIRSLLAGRLGLEPRDIGLFHVTPCPAKTLASTDFDGVVGIDALYGPLLKAMRQLKDEDRETMLFKGSGFGIGWEMAGGEAGGLRHVEDTLSVCGLNETIEALELVEAGRLDSVKYLEIRVCEDGCLGGPLTVAHRFQSRETLRRLVRMFGRSPRVQPEDVARRVAKRVFELAGDFRPESTALDASPLRAMKLLNEAALLAARLPGKYCAACGAPDCRTFAEDVVLGRAEIGDCPFMRGSGNLR